jgi:hypothetical protein
MPRLNPFIVTINKANHMVVSSAPPIDLISCAYAGEGLPAHVHYTVLSNHPTHDGAVAAMVRLIRANTLSNIVRVYQG